MSCGRDFGPTWFSLASTLPSLQGLPSRRGSQAPPASPRVGSTHPPTYSYLATAADQPPRSRDGSRTFKIHKVIQCLLLLSPTPEAIAKVFTAHGPATSPLQRRGGPACSHQVERVKHPCLQGRLIPLPPTSFLTGEPLSRHKLGTRSASSLNGDLARPPKPAIGSSTRRLNCLPSGAGPLACLWPSVARHRHAT